MGSPLENNRNASSYNKVIWERVWADCKRGLVAKMRMVTEGIVSLLIGYIVLAQFGTSGAAYDFGIEKAFVVPIALIVMMVIHGLWSWAEAPRKIYYDQQKTIQELRKGIIKAPEISIEFDPRKDISKRHEGKIWWVSVRIVNKGEHTANKVQLQIVSVEAIGKHKVIRQAVVDKISLAWIASIPYDQFHRYAGKSLPDHFPLIAKEERSVCVAEMMQSNFNLMTTLGKWDDDIWRCGQGIPAGHFRLRLKATADNKTFSEAYLRLNKTSSGFRCTLEN